MDNSQFGNHISLHLLFKSAWPIVCSSNQSPSALVFNVLPRLAVFKYPLMPGKHQALNDSTVNVIYFSLMQALELNDYGY